MASGAADRLAFTEHHREELRRIGLQDELIQQLEEALPAAANYLQQLDRTDEVGRWLKRFRHASKNPGRQLDSLLAQASRPDVPSSLVGALRRIAAADYEIARENGAPFDRAFTGDDGVTRIAALRTSPIDLLAVVNKALVNAPAARRRAEGSPGAILVIWDAVAPAGVRLSSSAGSMFRKLAGVCFEVITGDLNADPERAIRAAMRLERALAKGEP